jgi:hypothetical protein
MGLWNKEKKLTLVCGGTNKDNQIVRQSKDIQSKVDLDSLTKAAAGPVAELVELTHVHNGYIYVFDGTKKIASLVIDGGSYGTLTLCS